MLTGVLSRREKRPSEVGFFSVPLSNDVFLPQDSHKSPTPRQHHHNNQYSFSFDLLLLRYIILLIFSTIITMSKQHQQDLEVDETGRNSAAHPASQSMAFHLQSAGDLLFLQQIYTYIIYAWVPLSIAVIIFSTFWANIQAQNGKYTSTDDDWQACFTTADYQHIEISKQIANGQSKLASCILGLVLGGTCSPTCGLTIKTDCPSSINVQDINLPTGHFLGGLSYLGIQAVIFSAIAHSAMRRALHHPSWLMSTIALVFWFCFAIFTYYTVSPILPVPTQTNSTLLIYLYYATSYDKFKNLSPDSDSTCKKGFVYLWVYLTFILLVSLTTFIGGLIGIYAERVRYVSKNRKHYDPLKHTEVPLVIGSVAIIFYVLLVVAKIASSMTNLDAIYNFDNGLAKGKPLVFGQNYFPFAQATLDISTILGITSFMSVLRGYTIQSISAFRMACVTSLVFAIATYPAIVGAYQFYYYNNFDDFDSCKSFFLQSSKSL